MTNKTQIAELFDELQTKDNVQDIYQFAWSLLYKLENVSRQLEAADARIAKLEGDAVAVGVTAENMRVIQMLLNVCGAAFELADDSCQQDVDGELCHVVPDDAFSSLSNALEEIENTLPDEYEDLPNIVLQWAAIPRHALRNVFTHAQPVPVAVLPLWKINHWREAPCNGVDWAKGYKEGWNKVIQIVQEAGITVKSGDGEIK